MLNKILICGGILVVGILIGAYINPMHSIEEKIVYKDRTHTISKEIKTEFPDGKKVTVIETEKNEQSEGSSIKSSTPKPDWAVGVKYDLFTSTPVWTVDVNRRILWNIYGGVYGRTDGTVGVGLLYTF